MNLPPAVFALASSLVMFFLVSLAMDVAKRKLGYDPVGRVGALIDEATRLPVAPTAVAS